MKSGLDKDFFEYIVDGLATVAKSDLEETPERFNYTFAINEMVKYLKGKGMPFNKEIISAEVDNKILEEFVQSLPK